MTQILSQVENISGISRYISKIATIINFGRQVMLDEKSKLTF